MKLTNNKFQKLMADLSFYTDYTMSYIETYNVIFNHYVLKHGFLVVENENHETAIFYDKLSKREFKQERKRFRLFMTCQQINIACTHRPETGTWMNCTLTHNNYGKHKKVSFSAASP